MMNDNLFDEKFYAMFDSTAKSDVKYVLNKLDVCAIVEVSRSKNKILYNLNKGTRQLEEILKEFDKKKCYKIISGAAGFSALNFVDWVARNECINKLYISSLAIGKKHFEHLEKLYRNGKIKKCCFIVSDFFENRGLEKKYDYYEYFEKQCKELDWKYQTLKNHSKIILIETDKNKYILETSSNFNENPKIEQFSFECDNELFEFYKSFFEEALKDEH